MIRLQFIKFYNAKKGVLGKYIFRWKIAVADVMNGHISQGGPKSVTWVKMIIFGKKLYVIHLSNIYQKK